MSTGDTWIELATGQILDFDRLDDYLGQVRDFMDGVVAGIYGADTTIGGSYATFTYGASLLTLAATRSGINAEGHPMTATLGADGWTSIPFQDTAAIDYHLGARPNDRPSSVTGDTADGGFYFDEVEDAIGEQGAPDLVTDTGTGLAFRIDTLVSVWSGGGTRPVTIWKVNPVTASADAIWTGTASASGGHVVATVPHYFGQAAGSRSTTAADYRVHVEGLTVSTTNLATDPAYWYLGKVNTGVPVTTGQGLVPTWGTWLALFAVEHDTATGKHAAVNANSYSYNAGAGRLGVFQIPALELVPYFLAARQNGGANQAMAYTPENGVGNPAYVATISAISGTWARLPIPVRVPPDVSWTVESLSAVIWLLTAGASESVSLELIERGEIDGVSTVLATWVMGKPAASTWGTMTPASGPAFPFVVGPPAAGVIRYWRVYFTEPNPGNARVAGFYGTISVNKVSPLPH